MALQPCSSALTPRGSSSRLRCLKVQYLQHVLSNNTSMNVEFHTCPYYHGPVSYPAPGTGRRTRSAFGARAAVLLQYYSVLQCTTPVLLCTTKDYASTTLYYKVLQRTTPVLLCTTKYYSSMTAPYYKVLLQYHSVLQSTWSATTPALPFKRPEEWVQGLPEPGSLEADVF